MVGRDVFTNQDPGQFVECEEVSRMSLNPWIGECYLTSGQVYLFANILPDCEDETEILVSRPRREVSPRDSVAELEDLHATIRSLEQRISDLEKKCTS